MFFKLYAVLLLAHILGDFYLQSPRMAQKKKESYVQVLWHSLLYALPFVLLSLFMSNNGKIWLTMGVLLHGLIDSIKHIWERKANSEETLAKLFLTDQALHFLSLVFLSYMILQSGAEYRFPSALNDFFSGIDISASMLIKWFAALLCIGKPSNLFIRRILVLCRGNQLADSEESPVKAGRYIGVIERLIMLLFMAMQQYSAIGLVLTAKSIARYEKISKDKDFAEYYLLGTLLSTLFVILSSTLLH